MQIKPNTFTDLSSIHQMITDGFRGGVAPMKTLSAIKAAGHTDISYHDVRYAYTGLEEQIQYHTLAIN